jgi:O-methyltransferase
MDKTYADSFVAELVAFQKKVIANVREIKLSNNQENISHQCVVPVATYSPWNDHTMFRDTYDQIKANTLVDMYRCFELWNLVERHRHVQGDILEVGVWRGGTGCLLAKAAQLYSEGSRIHLADTFKGVVKASVKDTTYKGGEHADTTIGTVRALAGALGLTNIELMEGVFPDEVNFDASGNISLKLCHIDVDTYASAKDIFDYVWRRMVRGGVVVFDDYGFWGCEGVTELCNSIDRPDATFIHNLNGHAVVVKLR